MPNSHSFVRIDLVIAYLILQCCLSRVEAVGDENVRRTQHLVEEENWLHPELLFETLR